jgi:hypothetical protein
MTTGVCRRCGRPLSRDAGDQPETLADLPGAEQPPEAAGMLAGATPFDAQAGTDSGPAEYAETEGDGLCADCRAERRGRER